MSQHLRDTPLLSYDPASDRGDASFGLADVSFCLAVGAPAVIFFGATMLEDLLVKLFGDFRTGEAASILFAIVAGGLCALGAVVAGVLSFRRPRDRRGPAIGALIGMSLGSLVLLWCVAAAVL